MLRIAKLAVLAGYLLSKTVHASVDLTRRQSQVDNSAEYHIPIGSPGFQHNHSSAAVTFDQHSFFLGDERILIYSGEFHPWRVPTGAVLWRDILEKMKVWDQVVVLYIFLTLIVTTSGCRFLRSQCLLSLGSHRVCVQYQFKENFRPDHANMFTIQSSRAL